MAEKTDLDVAAGRRHIIERPRLTRLLDETSARVIMLVAPAGYGKTTLARQWLKDRPNVWYPATVSSADLAGLGHGLSVAAEGLIPGFGTRLMEWLPTRKGLTADAAVAAEILAHDLRNWPSSAWLAIDDYHLLDSPAAEEFINRLIEASTLRVVVTSRTRPSWATSRRLLYGELMELGEDSLRMDEAEAAAVLGEEHEEEARAVVDATNGWPAVIGLAAIAHLPTRLEGDIPTPLYDFIADELYNAMPRTTSEALCEISLLPAVSSATAERLLGPERARSLEEVTPGVLSKGSSTDLSLSPLMRAFFRRKLDEWTASRLNAAVDRAVDMLIEERSWDEAFELLQAYGRMDMLEDLLSESLYELANQGRIASLETFVEYGRAGSFESPLLDLADAELAFRQGFHERARAMARKAGTGLATGHPLATRAYCRAGQSAYFTERPAEAIEDLLRAKELARSSEDFRNAVWGHFIAAVELSDPEAATVLDAFESASPSSADDLLRVQSGRLLLATRQGGLAPALVTAHTAVDLIDHARDPTVRVAFLHAYGGALRLCGLYDDGWRAAKMGIEVAEAFHLDFARPHLYLTQAAAAVGTGRYREASFLLDQVEIVGGERGDAFLLVSGLSWRSRLLLLEGATEAAVRITAQPWPRIPAAGAWGEFLACRGLAVARNGDLERGLGLIEEATQSTEEVEARSLSLWVRALIELWSEPNARTQAKKVHRLIDDAISYARETSAFDSTLFAAQLEPALRGELELVGPKSRHVSFGNDPSGVLRLRAPSWRASPSPPQFERLTPRERQVYELLAEGRSNKEIAKSLFISESTAKVHVRRILKKLGVRTRTEAALLLARRPEAPTSDPARAPEEAHLE